MLQDYWFLQPKALLGSDASQVLLDRSSFSLMVLLKLLYKYGEALYTSLHFKKMFTP